MGKRILHVEDDGDICLLVKTLLKNKGYDVVSVSNGRQCMSELEKKGFDLILMDLMLPDMSGWEILEEIRRINNPTKIAFLSIVPISDSKLNKLTVEGVSDYILKPFDNENLIRRVSTILGE